MSWSIKLIGCRCAVREHVEAETTLPAGVKAAILESLQPEDGAPNGVRVEGAGHVYTGPESWRSGIGYLVVEAMELVCKSQAAGYPPATPDPWPAQKGTVVSDSAH